MRPAVHRPAREFGNVVRSDRFWCSAKFYQPVQLFCDLLARLRALGIRAQTFPGVLVQYRQNSKPSPVRQSLTHKVHAPTLVRKSSFWKRDSHLRWFRILRSEEYTSELQ